MFSVPVLDVLLNPFSGKIFCETQEGPGTPYIFQLWQNSPSAPLPPVRESALWLWKWQGRASLPALRYTPSLRETFCLSLSGSCLPCLHHLPFPSPGLKQGKFVLTFLEARCPGEGGIELGPPESGRGSSWLALSRPLLGPHGIHWRCARVQISLPLLFFSLCECVHVCIMHMYMHACMCVNHISPKLSLIPVCVGEPAHQSSMPFPHLLRHGLSCAILGDIFK